jgi:hypothetical protein
MPTPPPPFFDFSFWQNFVSNGLATLLGVIVGIPVALWIGRIEEELSGKERKTIILKSLYDELGYCEIELDRMVSYETIRVESGVLRSVLRNEIWHAYSDGGELEWIKDVSLIAQIAIRSVGDLADRYYDSVQYATEESSVLRINMVFKTLREAIDYSKKSVKKTMGVIKGLVPDVAK